MTRHLMIAATVVLAAWGAAQAAGSQASHVKADPGTLKWGPGPASLPAGSQAAVLEGDPAKPGAFTLRIKMPDGYAIAPHWHPADEHVTVIQGTFVMGLGEKIDRSKGHALEAGSFAMMPAGTRHFAWTKGDTIIQLHGTGPWGISYVNASDDPRRQAK
ncbi:MAG TPA: cupin domain-containing protein [Vicinamibacterales bacterium]